MPSLRTAASCSSHLPQNQDGCPRVRLEPGLTRLASSHKGKQESPPHSASGAPFPTVLLDLQAPPRHTRRGSTPTEISFPDGLLQAMALSGAVLQAHHPDWASSCFWLPELG